MPAGFAAKRELRPINPAVFVKSCLGYAAVNTSGRLAKSLPLTSTDLLNFRPEILGRFACMSRDR